MGKKGRSLIGCIAMSRTINSLKYHSRLLDFPMFDRSSSIRFEDRLLRDVDDPKAETRCLIGTWRGVSNMKLA
jgi:hypothetical protein